MLELKDVRAGYNGNEVLHGISLTVRQGDILAIIGPNGCGKTTLLRTIAGILPASGSVMLGGRPIAGYPRRELARRVAMLSQLSEVYFDYSIYDTVMMGRYPHRSKRLLADYSAEDREQVRAALTQLELWELRANSIAALSGGQLQRVFLARLIAQQPDIILLDEPTNHLDIAGALGLVDRMRDYAREQGKTVVGVLHDLSLALRLADRMLLMDAGKVSALGTPGEVLSSAALQTAYGIDVAGYMRDSLSRWNSL